MRELRENSDGTVSLMSGGVELIRGKPPTGAGISGFKRMYHPTSVFRCLQNNERIIKRAAHLDTYIVQFADDAITVSVTWRNGGAWSKTYELADMPAGACGLRRLVLGDILQARGV
ncbi:MAG: hypothetical protein ACYSUI_10815 [Planctomycetota bacterium]|jgi:hypothetical protein